MQKRQREKRMRDSRQPASTTNLLKLPSSSQGFPFRHPPVLPRPPGLPSPVCLWPPPSLQFPTFIKLSSLHSAHPAHNTPPPSPPHFPPRPSPPKISNSGRHLHSSSHRTTPIPTYLPTYGTRTYLPS